MIDLYESVYPRQVREGRNLEQKTRKSRSRGNSPQLDCSTPGLVECHGPCSSLTTLRPVWGEHTRPLPVYPRLWEALDKSLLHWSLLSALYKLQATFVRQARDRKMVRTCPVEPSYTMKNNIKLHLFLLRLVFKDLMVTFLPSSDETLATS